ncbi:unnamed protein product [Ectocarpus sp. 13 AM-2016]
MQRFVVNIFGGSPVGTAVRGNGCGGGCKCDGGVALSGSMKQRLIMRNDLPSKNQNPSVTYMGFPYQSRVRSSQNDATRNKLKHYCSQLYPKETNKRRSRYPRPTDG